MDLSQLIGRIVDVSGHAYVAEVEVGVTAIDANDSKTTVVVLTNDDGEFVVDLPAGPFVKAQAATGLVGTEPVQLDIDDDGDIVPGEVVFSVAFEQGSHIRLGGV